MLIHQTEAPTPPARLAVVGAGGFIGAAVADRAERAGVPVLRITRRDVDLLAPDAADRLAALLRPGDTVAAVAAMAPCKTAAMLRDNLILAAALVQSVSRVPVAHVINIGSDAVFADSDAPLTEASPKGAENLHGVMHLAREVMFAAEIKAPSATLRPTLVYGAGDPHNGYGPNRFRRSANRGEPIVLFGDGEERRDHVSADDVAELVWRIAERRSTGSLNVVTGTVASFREIAETVAALAARPGDAPVAVNATPRVGPMPHNGYRPFDPAATFVAFPDFRYTPLSDGLARAQRQEFPHG